MKKLSDKVQNEKTEEKIIEALIDVQKENDFIENQGFILDYLRIMIKNYRGSEFEGKNKLEKLCLESLDNIITHILGISEEYKSKKNT